MEHNCNIANNYVLIYRLLKGFRMRSQHSGESCEISVGTLWGYPAGLRFYNEEKGLSGIF